METLLAELEYNGDGDQVADQLEDAIKDVQQAIAEMKQGCVEIHHYERNVSEQ